MGADTNTGGLFDRVWTVPNFISLARLACAPLVWWLLFVAEEPWPAAILLGILGASDWVDGWIARRFDQGSALGKILDPVADRILLLSGVLALLIDNSIPRWYGILILAREVLIAGMSLGLAAAGAKRIDVLWVGKAGTFFVMFSLPAFLAADITTGWTHDLCIVFAWASAIPALAMSYYAAAAYVPAARAALKEGREGRAHADGSVSGFDRGCPMKAVIMAGGEGTRLRPLTSNQPKPMMPLVNRPMLEHIVALLAKHGFDDIVVTVAYLGNQIRDYFGDGSDFGIRMRYATEEQPLGTAGSVRNAADELDETFLVISGDVLTDIDLGSFVQAHREHKAEVSIALKRVENPLEFGIVITRPDGSIERFLEKPTWGEVFSDTINTGIYVLEPSIFDYIPLGEVVDFSGDVFPQVLEAGSTMHGHIADGYWEDVGTTEAYLRAHADVLDGKVAVDIAGFGLANGIWLGEGADVDPDAHLEAPLVIGPNCRIEAGARLRGYTVLGTDVVVRTDAFLERTVCHDHVFVGHDVRLRGSVIGRATDLRPHARLEEGVVVGDECFIGESAVVNPGVRIYPFKTVEAGAVVNSSIVWESRAARTLFGKRGIRGLANVDVTPEVAVRVAAALGTALKKGAVVTASRDTSRAARALKRAIIGGLNLAGVNVEDIELATVPLTRFQVRNSGASAGVTVRLAFDDPDSVEIRFFDADGVDIDASMQRKVERLLSREDFRRAFAGDIGDIVFPPRSIEFYTAALERSVDAPRLRERARKVVLDYSYGAASIVMPSVLAKLGAEVLAVNPFASTVPRSAADPEEQIARIASLVRASGSELGYVIAPDGERATIIDNEGHVVRSNEALLALVTLVADRLPNARIALPVSVTQEAERIATARGAEIVWTKIADASLMEVAANENIAFAASSDGGFIWPDFLPAFDALATLAKLLDLLSASGRSLADVVRDLPSVCIAHESVPTPWERKGAVMRELVERVPPDSVVLIDGVKIHRDDGWVLVLPDPEDPTTHVWAESRSDAEARQVAQEYARRIRQTVR